MPYTVGLSSGWWRIAHAQDLLGIGMKVMSVSTWGANFVQVDFENTSEFLEPGVIEQIKKAKDDLNISWGAHGEIGPYMAWESATEAVWKNSHRKLHIYLDNIYDFFVKNGERKFEKYKPEYINFHASNLEAMTMTIEKFRQLGQVTVTLNGETDWGEFLKNEKEKELRKWFQRNLLSPILSQELAHPGTRQELQMLPFVHSPVRKLPKVAGKFVDVYKKALLNPEVTETIKEIIKRRSVSATEQEIRERTLDSITQDEVDSAIAMLVLSGKISEEMQDEILDILYEYILEAGSTRTGRGIITDEERAYALIARYLYLHRGEPSEPLWKMFFKEKTWEDLEKDWKLKIVDAHEGRIQLMPELVAMVACRYIVGHFTAPPLPEARAEKRNQLEIEGKKWDEWYDKTAIEKLNYLKIIFGFENPEKEEAAIEGLQRVIHARHIYFLIKAFEAAGTNFTRIFFDAEHYLHNGLDPEAEIKSAADDFGKYVLAFHIGAPKPYHPVHEPVDIGSEAQRWTYKYAWLLRQKGFGKGTNAFLIFERGGARGGQSPNQFVAQSAAALRLIAEQLEKDTDPNNLPMEFYGISSKGFLSEDKQLAAIKEHFFDPLKGTLSMPEEEHTFLGGEYLKKPGAQAEKWKKEELR